MPADFINKRQLAHEIEEQLREALPGIAAQFVSILTGAGVDLVDGTPLGIRAGKIAEAMAQANLARRVRDIDGYRTWLRTAAAYVLGGLLEIGEPVILPPGHNLNPFRRYSGPSFADTEIYRAILAERQADRERHAEQALRERMANSPDDYDVKNCPQRQDGHPDVVCDKGFGHTGPCHPISTTTKTITAAAPAFRKLGEHVVSSEIPRGVYQLPEDGPRLGDDDTGADLVAELIRLGVPPSDPSTRVVAIEDNDETPD